MNYIAKQINQEGMGDDYYELFTPVEMTGVDGTTVQVLQSIGTYSLADLNAQKQNCLDQISSIEEKITAINNLN